MVELSPAERAFLESLPRTVHLFADKFEHEERLTLLTLEARGLCAIGFGPVSSMVLDATKKGRAALADAKQVTA